MSAQTVSAQIDLMVFSAHPDDESIFFGGVLPYYTQVQQRSTVHVSMTSGDWVRAPEVREAELVNADEIYFGRTVSSSIGLSPDPDADLHFPRFKDAPTHSGANHGGYADSIDATWDWWNDGELDGFGSSGQDAAAGKQKVIDAVATYIRVFQPAVIVTHDIDGEYGHDNHSATGMAAVEAYAQAADASYVDGNDPWQASKLYVHQSEANGLGSTGYGFTNFLFHDFWEQNEAALGGLTARQVAQLGLDEHETQGSRDVSTVYRTGEGFDGHHSEWWGLLESTVGPDTIADAFSIEGYNYNGWARGDFFENIVASTHAPSPAALPAGLTLLALAAMRRRSHRQTPGRSIVDKRKIALRHAESTP